MSSKNFETQLYIKHYKSNLIEELIAFGVNNLKIKLIDNWQYENETQVNDLTDIERYVNNGKIIILEGKYKDLNCGCFVSKLADCCFECDIWVSTKIDSGLNDEYINEHNSYIYDMIIDMLKKLVTPHEFICCISGIEMSVEYSNDINQIMNNSTGILQIVYSCNNIMSNNLSLNVKQDGDYLIIRPL